MKYKVLLFKSDEGYSVSCSGLPGCWSQAETESAALENIGTAHQEYLDAVKIQVRNAGVREVEVTV